MIRRIAAFCFLFVVSAAAPVRSGEVAGAWTATIEEHRPGRIAFSMQSGRNNHQGSQFDLSDFTGLTSAQVHSSARVPVQFDLSREAGTISYDGTFRNGRGAGDFTFSPNRDFPKLLRSVGVEFDAKRGEEDRELFNLAIFDVTTDFIRSMQAIGYKVPLQKYVEFRIFNVNPAYEREMAAVGFPRLTAAKLVETRIHGATPDYIREMRAAGENLTLDQYIESRIFQVTPEFAAEMGRAGYADLRRDVLVQFRIHGVTTEFIRELRQMGYTRIPAQKLVEMRIHGVTPEFIQRVEAAGYHKVPIDKLVQMRIFDIDPKMVKALDESD